MNARALPPNGTTNTQSYAWVLREIFLNKLSSLSFFSGFTIRRTRRVAIQSTQDLPVLGVYLVDEISQPDGDGNAGHIRFVNTCRIGFQVVIANNDEAAAESTLDQAFWQIMNGIWRDAGITNLILAKTPDNVGFESVMRGTRRHVWGTAGLNNEMPVAELQYEASILYRDEFAVPVTDDLTSIYEQTNFPNDNSGDPAGVEQVNIRYTFTPATASQLMRGVSNGRNTNPNASSAGGGAPAWSRGAQGRAQGAPRGDPQK